MSKLSDAVAHARHIREVRAALGDGKAARAFGAPPDKLRQARRALNYSQEAFAVLLGVSRVTVAAWEAGTATPSEAHMDKIMELLITADQVDSPPELGPVEIVRLRKVWGCTQAEFARGIETSARTLGNWETGKTRPGVVASCWLLDSWGLAARLGKIETLEELKKAQNEKKST